MDIKQRRTDKVIVQERAVRTREKLLAAALEMYTVKGYHKTTVDEIAGRAGLSTGIAYRYFKNKKELLLSALSYAFDNIKALACVSEEDLYGGDISQVLTAFERIHTEYRSFHEELEGLRHSDPEVRELYGGFESRALTELYDNLPAEIKRRPHSKERLNLAVGMMEYYCHAFMNRTFDDDELMFMRDEVTATVRRLLGEEGTSVML